MLGSFFALNHWLILGSIVFECTFDERGSYTQIRKHTSCNGLHCQLIIYFLTAYYPPPLRAIFIEKEKSNIYML